jgi:hypothetical protein
MFEVKSFYMCFALLLDPYFLGRGRGFGEIRLLQE